MVMILSPSAISLTRKWGLLDHPDARKQHGTAMPLAGGPLLFPIVLAAMLIAFWSQGSLLYLLSGAALIFVMGIWDDRVGVHFSSKFLIQIVAALLVMQSGLLFDLNKVVLFSSVGIEYGRFLSMAVTLVWIVGVTNAVNIIDGMDGLAAGLCFNAFAGMGVLALVSGSPSLAAFCVIMSGALLGFLRYNIHPARTFLGDSGSMLLGFILAVLSIVQSSKTATFLVIVVPALLLALPMLDTAFAFARRGVSGRNPFKADRGHLHHRLLDLNFTIKQTLGLFFSLSVGMGLLAFWLAHTQQVYVLTFAVSILVLTLAVVKAMQVYNFHGLIKNINRRMRTMAKRAVNRERDGEERLYRNFIALIALSVLNMTITTMASGISLFFAAAAVGIFIVGLVDVIMSRGEAEARYETIHIVLFLSLVLNQVAIMALWHRDYLVAPQFASLAFALLILLGIFIYRTGTFAVFLQDPMEIVALYMGVIICILAKHFLGAPTMLAFALPLVSALVLYILLKIYLSGYRVRSWTYSLGFAAGLAVLVSVPWWG
jgi:UDP-GlcNAc:undecaprenyl-phosphate GlcNAc-1-phosphate transferase